MKKLTKVKINSSSNCKIRAVKNRAYDIDYHRSIRLDCFFGFLLSVCTEAECGRDEYFSLAGLRAIIPLNRSLYAVENKNRISPEKAPTTTRLRRRGALLFLDFLTTISSFIFFVSPKSRTRLVVRNFFQFLGRLIAVRASSSDKQLTRYQKFSSNNIISAVELRITQLRIPTLLVHSVIHEGADRKKRKKKKPTRL